MAASFMKHFSLLNSFVLSLLLVSCGNNDSSQKETTSSDTLLTDSTSSDELPACYQIPSPSNLFSYLKESGVKVTNINALNSPEKASTYSTSSEKAVNFGIYTTDLFFCSSFNFKADVLRYFEILKTMSEDLGISDVVTEKTIKRIESNLSKNDSLINITSEVYNEAAINLEKRNEGATLSLLIGGGWIECLYLSTQSIGAFKSNPKAIEIIAEQKLTAENLMEMLNQNKKDERVAALSNDMKEVFQIFDSVSVQEVEPSIQLTKGKRIIGGSESFTFTEENYTSLVNALKKIRNKLTKNS